MIEDIQKYDADYFLLGHESICDLDEMDTFWEGLKAASQAASTSLHEAVACFKAEIKREPNEKNSFSLKHLSITGSFNHRHSINS